MQRRAFLCSGVAACVYARAADARPRFPNDGKFHWWNPGGNSFTGTLDQAFAALKRQGVPMSILDQFRVLVQQGAYAWAHIRPGEPYDYMLSAGGKVERDVIAETHLWPVHVSKAMKVYVLFVGDTIHELGLPSTCGNWTYRSYVFGTQVVCVPCEECE